MKMVSIFEEFRWVIVAELLQGRTVPEIYKKYFEHLDGYRAMTLKNYVCSHKLRNCFEEWVLPKDDTPVPDKDYIYLSIDVMVIDQNGDRYIGFYDEKNELWHRKNGITINNVVAWQSLEQIDNKPKRKE